MSLGFAVADSMGIFLTIESAGAHVPMGACHETLGSKIINLQPGIAALATGYLLNWLHVRHEYSDQGSVGEAAREVTRLLKASPFLPANPNSYGLICGYDGEIPNIYRIAAELDRPERFDCDRMPPFVVQPIGDGWGNVTLEQIAKLGTSDPSRLEVIKAVLEDVREKPEFIVPPVQCRALLIPGYELELERIRNIIRRIAFKKFEDDGFVHGRHLQHWLEAKKEMGFSEYNEV